jgi:hypothetical protein
MDRAIADMRGTLDISNTKQKSDRQRPDSHVALVSSGSVFHHRTEKEEKSGRAEGQGGNSERGIVRGEKNQF